MRYTSPFNEDRSKKKCNSCNLFKELDEFFPSRKSKCIECLTIYDTTWKKNNREKANVVNRTWRGRKLETDPEYFRRYYRDNKHRWVHSNRKNKYGLSPEEYLRMLVEQDHLCAICGNPETRQIKGKLTSLSVDHDHKTGKVRQLLCNRCNVILGKLKENINVSRAITEYLLKWNSNEPGS